MLTRRVFRTITELGALVSDLLRLVDASRANSTAMAMYGHSLRRVASALLLLRSFRFRSMPAFTPPTSVAARAATLFLVGAQLRMCMVPMGNLIGISGHLSHMPVGGAGDACAWA